MKTNLLLIALLSLFQIPSQQVNKTTNQQDVLWKEVNKNLEDKLPETAETFLNIIEQNNELYEYYFKQINSIQDYYKYDEIFKLIYNSKYLDLYIETLKNIKLEEMYYSNVHGVSHVLRTSLFGLLMVYSASNVVALEDYNDSFYYFKRQALFMTVGIILMFLITKININIFYDFSFYIFVFCLFLLILVLIPGIGKIRNVSRSWFGIGSFGIQPSEAAKVGLVIFVAKYLSNNYNIMYNIKIVFKLVFTSFLSFNYKP